MARGNTRRRALIREVSLVGQAEGISTKSLLEIKAAQDAAAAVAEKKAARRAARQASA